jgi:glycosyltransferase involved in cell wall biosynthesis
MVPSGPLSLPGVIAFSKDWHEDPTSNHHVLRELARHRRVLWLNSIGTRTPKLSSTRDLGKIRRKLGEFAKGPINVENDLWVYTPIAIPMHQKPAVRLANRALLRATVAVLRRRLGMDDFHLWTFLPNVGDYVGSLGESLSVYYCVDEWSMFSYLDRDETVAAERALLSKVDCVFAINQELAEAKRAQNPETHLAPHGVDHALFARALDDATPVPADIKALKKPILGFYGTLREWVDVDLLAAVARARPDWSIALIGQKLGDVSAAEGIPNIHFLGQKKHADLPAYCKGMDVGLIPYRIDERMKFVNPIKLREYLSAGLPVVSTAVPEVRRYERWCSIAEDAPAFIRAIEKALAPDETRAARGKERSTAMLQETWPMRVAAVTRIIDDAVRRKDSGGHQ